MAYSCGWKFNGFIWDMYSFVYESRGISQVKLLKLYEAMLLSRRIEERMLLLLRQGRLSKWFAGMGQEAIAVGSTLALSSTDYILPLHRNLGVFTSRDLPLDRLFCQLFGKADGYTQGRDRSFHFGVMDRRIIGMISHLGAQLSVADGLALASVLDGRKEVVLVFCGEGATSEGDFHEALNVAACWRLPVIFLIESNGYALSTPSFVHGTQYACKRLVDRAVGYGMPAERVVGNDVLAVYSCVRRWARRLRKDPFPVMIEAETFRMRGHEEASGVAYVPEDLLQKWALRDPVSNYARWLVQRGLLTQERCELLQKETDDRIMSAVGRALSAPVPVANAGRELAAVYAPIEEGGQVFDGVVNSSSMKKMRFVDAITEALTQAMEVDDDLVLMGQDIAEYGGVFKVTRGLLERFGSDRVRNTPLCESAIIGIALGLAMAGKRAMVEMQFADFVSCGFNQIINNLAKVYYRWQQAASVTIRMPTGAGVGAGPFHSQSIEAWFVHTPGLKVLYPATPYEAKGLLLAALCDPNPCLFFEHKALYRTAQGDVPSAYYTLPIGKGVVAREGDMATVVTYGMGVQWAIEAAAVLKLGLEVINLCSLLPWDKALVLASVRKTSRVLVLYEACLTGGVGAEIAAWIGAHAFEYLDAPVLRVASLDTPVPLAGALERSFLPKDRFFTTVKAWIDY